MSRISCFVLVLAAALAATPAQGHGTLGSETQHMYLVQDCVAAGWDAADIGVKCFESVPDLMDVLWSTVFPTASDPLTVDIGPGTFTGTLICPSGEGYTTFRGAGRDNSVINGVSFGSGLTAAAVSANNCTALAFQDLKLVGMKGSAFAYGTPVAWAGGGSSNWTDVELVGEQFGWYDVGCAGSASDPPSGVHYFWGSKVTSQRTTYFSECGETWFYGGEINALSGSTLPVNPSLIGVWISHRAEFHMFGSAVRSSSAGTASGSGAIYGVQVGPSGTGVAAGNGEFHAHGGVISVNSSNLSGVSATGLIMNKSTSGNAKSHTLETAFAVKGGSTSTRLSGTGVFESPQLWEARTTPPTAGGAIDGQDSYIETDCNASGCSSGSDPHLLIYKAGCTGAGGPWFDIVRNACRN